MVYREAPGDEAATGTADEYGSIEMDRVHECLQVRRKIAEVGSPSRDGSRHHGPSESRRKREWTGAV